MNIRLKLSSALLIFISSFSSAFAVNLTITAIGDTPDTGLIRVFDTLEIETEVATCDLSVAPCNPSLPSGNYDIFTFPAEGEVPIGYSLCSGITQGNRCTINLTVDTTVTATYETRNLFKVYDTDADGIDDLTELALNKSPVFPDGENPDGTYLDTDTDGLPDFIETNLTNTNPNTNDSASCTGTAPATDLTGQWDVRSIDSDSIAAGHDLDDTDDIDAIDTTKEWLSAFSICHTVENGLQIFEPGFGYASTVNFNGTTISATFSDSFGDFIFSALFDPTGGALSQGSFQDLNASSDGGNSQIRAERRMTKAELANLTAANISGVFGAQLTKYDSQTDQIIDKPDNPVTTAIDFRASSESGKAMSVKISSLDGESASVFHGYFIPSVATFYFAARTPDETGLDLDNDGSYDDQILGDIQSSITIVESPLNGIGGLFRGEFEDKIFKDFNSDFTNDGFLQGNYTNLYGKGVTPGVSAFTLNIEKSDGSFVIKNKISLINVNNLPFTITVDTPDTTGIVLVDNTDADITNNSAAFLSTNSRIVGYKDGDRIGTHSSNDNNGTNLSFDAKEIKTSYGNNNLPNGAYTFHFTGEQLSAAHDLSTNFTNSKASELPVVTAIKLDNRTLNRSISGARLINSDTSHKLTWNRAEASTLSGSTGADTYRVQIQKYLSSNIGLSGANRLEMYTTCTTNSCSLTLPKDVFYANASYTIKVFAFDTANDKNNSISAGYYVSAASKAAGCSINSNNNGLLTNGTPCAEYYQVQNPRKFGDLVSETATLVDYAVNRPTGTPKAIVVLLAGGSGNAGIIGKVTSNTTKQVGINFLVRSAEMFAEQGYLAVTIDRPTDHKLSGTDPSYLFDNYRISPEHAHDIASVLNEVNTENLNVFLAGTSRGAISALNQFKVANAISLSVPVNSNAAGYTVVAGSHPVGQTSDGEIAPEDVYVPVHYLINPDETCNVTVPLNPVDQTMFNRFTQNFGQNLFDASVTTASNGVGKFGSACGATHDHGFLGSELDAVTATTNWFDGLINSYQGNHPPVTRPIRQLVKPDTPRTFEISSLKSVVVDTEDDPIDLDIASTTSTRGGTFAEAPLGLLYTPPVGANNITDAIIFIVGDNKGGRTSMVMTIDISDDADDDGLPDSIYPADGSTADAESDADSDGLSLLEEYQAGTDPELSDTDGDGISDLIEITNGLNPTVPNNGNNDSDGDGFTDAEEAAIGSDLFDPSSNPGFISFSNATPSVQEDAGTANISVTRSGGTFGTVSVDCNSSDIISQATAGTDYNAVVNDTITWPDGDSTPKACNIVILDDTENEGDEIFLLDITNPSGGAKLAP